MTPARSTPCSDILPVGRSYFPPHGIFPDLARSVSLRVIPLANQGGIKGDPAQSFYHSHLFDRVNVANCVQRSCFYFIGYFNIFVSSYSKFRPVFPVALLTAVKSIPPGFFLDLVRLFPDSGHEADLFLPPRFAED